MSESQVLSSASIVKQKLNQQQAKEYFTPCLFSATTPDLLMVSMNSARNSVEAIELDKI